MSSYSLPITALMSCKNFRRMMARCEPPGEDRISILPDVLRLHILSFLPRKYAIRTGVLSSQWRDLWKTRFPSIVSLNFNKQFAESKTDEQLIAEIDSIMRQQVDKKIEVFNLYFYPGKDYQEKVTDWIKQVVQQGAEEFNLDFSQGKVSRFPGRLEGRRGKYELKDFVFKDSAVEFLQLKYCKLHRNFSFRVFGWLANLCLHGVNVNDYMLERILMYCPQLARLDLKECCLLQDVKIDSRQLRTFVLIRCLKVRMVAMCAPQIKSFWVVGGFPSFFVVNTNRTLEDVVLVTGRGETPFQRRNWVSLVFSIVAVKVMSLSLKALQYIFGQSHFTTHRLPQLKELQIVVDKQGDDPIEVCSFFVRCDLPLLERLFIELPQSYNHQIMDVPITRQCKMARPIIESLKLVRISGFKKNFKEQILLRCFLDNAVDLEYVVLVIPHEHDLDICRPYARQHLCQEMQKVQMISMEGRIVLTCSKREDRSSVICTRAIHPTNFE